MEDLNPIELEYIMNKPKRIHVGKACFHCRKAHQKCNNERPCNNCTKYKKLCFDVENKVRKNTKRKNGEEGVEENLPTNKNKSNNICNNKKLKNNEKKELSIKKQNQLMALGNKLKKNTFTITKLFNLK